MTDNKQRPPQTDSTPAAEAPAVDILASDVRDTAATRGQVFMMLADPILEGLYRSRFQNAEYCVVWSTTADRWNQALLSFPYDVVVVDFSLFPADPIGNLLEIKRLSPESDIIVLSESDDARIAINAFQSGITDYFLKPTNPETLAWAIDRCVHRRALTSSNEPLAADLRIFGAAHHINVSESDVKMRDLTLKHLIALLQAGGALWFWPETEKKPDGPPFRLEAPAGSEEQGKKALLEFSGSHADLLRNAFNSDLTSRPEQWRQGSFVWIPLRNAWMGGCLLYDVKTEPGQALHARMEFLVRNVEVSLENYRRYVEARKLTYIDELTGLYNSRYLDLAVGAAIEQCKSSKSGFSILFIDIDKFKSVNDQHGHLVGSQLLVDAAHHLKKSLRRRDHLFRYGGDEFVCILYEISLEKAIEAAERIRADMENHHFLIQHKDLKITLSIGVARFPEHGRDKQRILMMADEAMYGGKKSGRNTVFLAGAAGQSKAS